MHHPFDWLNDFDRKAIETLLCDGCNFILQGHMHSPGILQTMAQIRMLRLLRRVPAIIPGFPNSYNFVQLNLDKMEGKIYLRMYSNNNGGFWTKDVMSFRNVKDGTYAFPFSKKLCNSLGFQEKEIAKMSSLRKKESKR